MPVALPNLRSNAAPAQPAWCPDGQCSAADPLDKLPKSAKILQRALRPLRLARIPMMKTLLLAVLCGSPIAFVACAGAPKSDDPKATELTVGKVQGEIQVGLSAAKVLEVLGSPNIITTDEQRREVWVYDKVSTDRMDASKSSYGTLLILGGSSFSRDTSTRQKTLTILIKFDAEKKVRDFAYNYTQF
jgi:outer membrane protein assembly factor BamE (lipoprotein component of BamABCDE complex)